MIFSIIGRNSILDTFQFHGSLITFLIEFVFGDLKTGIIIGSKLETIAFRWINIAAAIAPDSALSSIIFTIFFDCWLGKKLALISHLPFSYCNLNIYYYCKNNYF
ncbi:PTS sugar transporter subunit IIC [Arsenophonus symbiont of Ornithomya chloropus]|uniref:PTS sugar transporter subunit IIC n=1 Tax=Arsenophonus symbiont of Ornithomya chloropus TaxID=634121 RepID=UPI0032B27B9E